MSIFRQISRGLAALMNGRDADRAVDDEVRHYLEQATIAHIARGLAYEDAVRAATLEIGNTTVVREQVRTSGWEHLLETIAADVRYAFRRLRNTPGFTATAVTTLAVGTGASTAVFSALSPILLEPLPFPFASRVVAVEDRSDQGTPMPATLGTYDELRARTRSFDELAAADRWQPSLTGTGSRERLEGQRVTANYFKVFGANPIAGRTFTEAEDEPGGTKVAIVSDAFLQRRLAGDRSIVGRTIELDGDPYVVVGVMPHGFPNVLSPRVNVWRPLAERSTGELNSRAWGHHYDVVGRLSPATTVAVATREILDIGRAPEPSFARPAWADLKRGLIVRPLQDAVSGGARPALYVIIGAVLLLLAIASVNVTNLLLARSAQRRPELAMRMALGAGRSRLARQLLTESVVLALLGGVLGLGLAQIGVRFLVALSPPGPPRVDAIRLDTRVFVFALALTALVGVLVGLVPAAGALQSERTGLQHGSRRTTSRAGAARSVLVVAEVALALVLLVTAGLLLRSVQRLVSVAPGFDPANVLTVQVIEPGRAFASDVVRLQVFEQVVDAVRRVPGVASVALTSQVPLSGEVDGYGLEWQPKPAAKPGDDGSALRYAVTPGYIATMRIPLRRGRLLDASDRPGAPEAVVINESLARRVFGDRDPIGQRVRFGPEVGSERPWRSVVGVGGDVKQYSLAVDAPDAFYVANGQWWWVDNVLTLVIRTTGNAAALAPAIQRAVWSVNANLPIQRVATMTALVAASAGQRRSALTAMEAFATAALLLAAVGLYRVISGGVAERMREIGIRTALGATPRDVVRGIVGRSLILTLAGAVIGFVAAYASSRFLDSMRFSVSRFDLLTNAAVVALLASVTLLASWAPARRAPGIDPTITLRAE